jgi:hypothetical protein
MCTLNPKPFFKTTMFLDFLSHWSPQCGGDTTSKAPGHTLTQTGKRQSPKREELRYEQTPFSNNITYNAIIKISTLFGNQFSVKPQEKERIPLKYVTTWVLKPKFEQVMSETAAST